MTVAELEARHHARFEPAADGIPTAWIDAAAAPRVLSDLKAGGYRTLYDLTAIDERARRDPPAHAFTLVYHVLSYERNEDLRIKVALHGEEPEAESVTGVWPAANWYEREAWDMFGIRFAGHPLLRRILLPPWWKGHALRKEHPARATETEPYRIDDEDVEALRFSPEEWGMTRGRPGVEHLYLNLGPQHPGTHGVVRFALQLDGEEIVDVAPDIGFHHRGAEKMAERQTWHTYIPYTDRVDYLAGVLNNHAYLLSVEKLAGIEVPPRAKVIRILLSELFRIASHLVWYGTFAQDVGQLSPVFYIFNDRERLFDVVQAVCGDRMHPNWFRIGGVAQDLPRGWETLVRDFLAYMPKRLARWNRMVLKNRIFRARTRGVGAYTRDEAFEWGVTGPGLRACGFPWDFRKQRPYGGYEDFEFEVPTEEGGDCYARALVRVEEIVQSLRIVGQCVDRMPSGPVKADHPLASPPDKARTMRDIETLITHFLDVSWGPPLPPGEAHVTTEAAKGAHGYYLVSDGGTSAYRCRIRSACFPHLQMVPLLARGASVADLLAILGSVDFVLAEVDR